MQLRSSRLKYMYLFHSKNEKKKTKVNMAKPLGILTWNFPAHVWDLPPLVY
jgi:hypothetical protein